MSAGRIERRPMHTEIETFLLESIAATCGTDVQALRLETPLVDIDLDSLSVVSIVGQLEAAYGVNFGASAAAAILEASTIADLSATIASQIEHGRMKGV